MPSREGRNFRWQRVLAALTLAAILVALPADAQTTDLTRIRADIENLRGRLEEVRRQSQSAERELEEVDLEIGIKTRELELARAAEARLSAEQAELEAQIAVLIPRIVRQKADLRKRLVALYRLGGLSYVRMLLALDAEKNPIEAMSMLRYLVTRDARLVDRFQTSRQQLTGRQAELKDRQARVSRARGVVEERRNAVLAAREQQERVLARLRSVETGTARRLADLEEKARRLQRLVDLLSQQKKGLDVPIAISSVQGALAWPVEGKVIERFGRQRNAKFATFTVNNGLKIEAEAGTEVRAVFQGTVLFSQWFKGYGNLIILDHGHRVFSLYGNLKASRVAVGDRILTGQAIAGVGESEDEGSGYLYFEIRQDNKPEDPQTWLR